MKPYRTHYTKILLVLPCLLWFMACNQKDNVFRFSGTIEGITQTTFYLYGEGNDFTGFDTLEIKDGRFQYAKTLEEPVLLRLMYPNFAYTYIVAEPGVELHMEGSGSKLGEALIKGSEENELLSRFRTETHALKANEQHMAAAHFIQNNAQRLAAVAVFRKYFVDAKEIDTETASTLLEELKKAQPESKLVAAVEKQLQPFLLSSIDRPLPSFEALCIDSTNIVSDSLKGKPLLIGLFSTWRNENYQIVPQMARYEQEYADSLGLLAISLDYDLHRCTTRITQDSLQAPVVCDGRAFDSPIVQLLGVRYLPGNILVDHKGTIVGRDIPFTELDNAIARTVKKYREKPAKKE